MKIRALPLVEQELKQLQYPFQQQNSLNQYNLKQPSKALLQ